MTSYPGDFESSCSIFSQISKIVLHPLAISQVLKSAPLHHFSSYGLSNQSQTLGLCGWDELFCLSIISRYHISYTNTAATFSNAPITETLESRLVLRPAHIATSMARFMGSTWGPPQAPHWPHELCSISTVFTTCILTHLDLESGLSSVFLIYLQWYHYH